MRFPNTILPPSIRPLPLIVGLHIFTELILIFVNSASNAKKNSPDRSILKQQQHINIHTSLNWAHSTEPTEVIVPDWPVLRVERIEHISEIISTSNSEIMLDIEKKKFLPLINAFLRCTMHLTLTQNRRTCACARALCYKDYWGSHDVQ